MSTKIKYCLSCFSSEHGHTTISEAKNAGEGPSYAAALVFSSLVCAPAAKLHPPYPTPPHTLLIKTHPPVLDHALSLIFIPLITKLMHFFD